MCFKVAVLKISQNILLMQLLKHVKSSVWIMREISSFFLNSPCSFSSSARTKKFGSDQIGLGPQRLPRLLFFTEEGRITCHPSVCTCSPSSYLSILHLLHQILLPLHLLLVCFIFFFMFSFCQASTCLPVLLCDLKCSEDAFVILKIWSENIKYSISELLRQTDCALAHINFISGHEEMYVSTGNASLDTAQSKWAFQFCSSNSCIKG